MTRRAGTRRLPIGFAYDVGGDGRWKGYGSVSRTPYQQRYDLFAQQEVRFGRTHQLLFSVNIDNLFDLKTVTDYNQTINRNSLRLGDEVYFSPNGFDPWALMNQVRASGTSMRYYPLVVIADGTYYTKPYSYMERRAFRFQVRYSLPEALAPVVEALHLGRRPSGPASGGLFLAKVAVHGAEEHHLTGRSQCGGSAARVMRTSRTAGHLAAGSADFRAAEACASASAG